MQVQFTTVLDEYHFGQKNTTGYSEGDIVTTQM